MSKMSVVLCDEKNGNMGVTVRAEIIEGQLKISGQDIGIDVESILGATEYEYFYDFDRKNTEHLLMLITENETPIEKTFVSRFGGIKGCTVLREFCDENGIEYRFFNYF